MSAAGSQAQLLRIAESTFNTTPATPTGIITRFKSLDLQPVKDIFESKEIRNDRQRSDVRHGVRMGQGSLDGELSAGAYDDFLESLLNGTWSSDVLKVGTTRKSFTMEQGHPDISTYFKYTGAVVDKATFDFKTGDIVGVKFDFMAADCDDATATLFSSTSGPTTDSPMDCLSGYVKKGGVSIAVVSAATLNASNNNEAVKVIGSPSVQSITAGRFTLDGNMSIYLLDTTYSSLFLDETEFTLEFQAAKGTKSYIFHMERCKMTGFKPPVNKETNLLSDINFMALAPTSGTETTLRITRDLV